MNVMMCPRCISIAPIPTLDASVSIVNISIIFGKASNGAKVRATFKFSNAAMTSSFHANASRLRNSISGQLMVL